ncbi:MAG TPA: hypothetical protein VIB79_22680 [Candidatus Binatia bacterium]|jgi:hypothetical protein
MQAKAEFLGPTVVRIELLHGLLAGALWLVCLPVRSVDPGSLLAGAAFMGINFFLLTAGIRWVLAPFAARGRIRVGVGLLLVKTILFLGLISLLLFRVRMEPLSFTLGFSCLLVAITCERIWAFARGE